MGHSATELAAGRIGEPVDRLTGLGDRDRFARAVDQADRDRDRMLVAVLAIDGLAEVNRLCGHHAGDDLLRVVGRRLGGRASVDVTVARLGGGRFGLLWAPAGDGQPVAAVEPIVDELRLAARGWAEHLAGLGTPSPVVPMPVAGVAAGFTERTWSEAELALEVATTDPAAPAVVRFAATDPRVAEHRRRQRLIDELGRAVDRDPLAVATSSIERLGNDERLRHDEDLRDDTSLRDGERNRHPGMAERDRRGLLRWIRIGPHWPGAGRATDPLPADGIDGRDLITAPGLAGAIDRRLLDRAAHLLTEDSALTDDLTDDLTDASDRASVDGRAVLRITVPLLGPLTGWRSALGEMGRRCPGIVVEVGLDRLAALTTPARADLARRLDDLGWGLTVAGFDGGMEAWRLAVVSGARYLQPAEELLRTGADADTAAGRILSATVTTAAAEGRPLLAPAGVLADGELRRLGIELVVRPALNDRPRQPLSQGSRPRTPSADRRLGAPAATGPRRSG